MPRYAIVYVRSAVTTAKVGAKLETCHSWATQHGFRVAAVFVEYASGLDPQLPVLAQALDRAQGAQATLVGYSCGDIARSSQLYEKRIAELQKLGVAVLYVSQEGSHERLRSRIRPPRP